jgi:glutaredoxin 3
MIFERRLEENMSDVTVYSGSNCPYCERAKALLKKKKAEFREFNVQQDETKLEEMLARSGGRKSVPQIFIDGKHVGGCDDLYALDSAGKLDALLGLASP